MGGGRSSFSSFLPSEFPTLLFVTSFSPFPSFLPSFLFSRLSRYTTTLRSSLPRSGAALLENVLNVTIMRKRETCLREIIFEGMDGYSMVGGGTITVTSLAKTYFPRLSSFETRIRFCEKWKRLVRKLRKLSQKKKKKKNESSVRNVLYSYARRDINFSIRAIARGYMEGGEEGLDVSRFHRFCSSREVAIEFHETVELHPRIFGYIRTYPRVVGCSPERDRQLGC